MAELKMTIQLRRGLANVLAGKILGAGEPAYAIDTKVLKIGDGVNSFAQLPVANKDSWTADIAAAVADINAELAKKADKSFIGDIPAGYDATTVVGYINEKAQEVLESATGGSSESAAAVKAALDTYKSENDARVKLVEDAIGDSESGLTQRVGAAEGDIDLIQAQLQGFEDTAAAVKTVTDGLASRIVTIENDYLKAEDKAALQQQITTNANAITLLTDGADPDKVDSVKDLIAYVEEHGAEVTGIKEDIAENAEAISGLDTKVTGIETAINGEGGIIARITAIENDTTVSTHISDAVAHITADERTKWNKAVADIGAIDEGKTVAGLISEVKTIAEAAQTADQVESAIDEKIEALDLANNYATIGSVDDVVDRVDALEEESKLHAKAADLTAHTDNSDIHITSTERTLWTSGEVNVSRLVGTLVIDGGEEAAE